MSSDGNLSAAQLAKKKAQQRRGAQQRETRSRKEAINKNVQRHNNTGQWGASAGGVSSAGNSGSILSSGSILQTRGYAPPNSMQVRPKILTAEELGIVEEEEAEIREDNASYQEQRSKALSSYLSQAQDKDSSSIAQRTMDHVTELQCGKKSCQICLEQIPLDLPVWQCNECYYIFHLQCIKEWVQSAARSDPTPLSDTNFPDRKTVVYWNCPNCRVKRDKSDAPSDYYCFCGKERDPIFNGWRIPHSCGELCGLPLRPECGHQCSMLCHPGPCPPCPRQLKASCHCGRVSKVTRCGKSKFSCGQECGTLLPCGIHKCPDPCHDGECSPCQMKSTQPCRCGRIKLERLCREADYQCDNICGKPYACGHHNCMEVCHTGTCGECLRSGERSCPCGKSKASLPCTEDVRPCGATCDKVRDCGIHRCENRCHTGACGTCLHMTKKTCRCRGLTKEVKCSSKLTCDRKCQKDRNCGKHRCRRKCCPGDCPPCEETCARRLACRNHNCEAGCHQGSCLPCPRTVQISCDCGNTVIVVPCGQERDTPPPKCVLACRKPSYCHHPHQTRHKCHPGRCPKCVQRCGIVHSDCGHECQQKCHHLRPDAASGQGSKKGKGKASAEVPKVVVRPCPPCTTLVEVPCLGGHETVMEKCPGRSTSCRRPCGNPLPCGVHTCDKECHVMKGLKNCNPCERGCERPRDPPCPHPCKRACHSDPCAQCNHVITKPCYCGNVHQTYKCHEVTAVSGKDAEALWSCGFRCSKRFPNCNHQCRANCHPGECPGADECGKNVTVTCECKRLKDTLPCHTAQAKQREMHTNTLAVLGCDNECESIKLAKKEEERKAREAAGAKEAVSIGSASGVRKSRKRKQRVYTEEESNVLDLSWLIYSLAGVIVLLIVALMMK